MVPVEMLWLTSMIFGLGGLAAMHKLPEPWRARVSWACFLIGTYSVLGLAMGSYLPIEGSLGEGVRWESPASTLPAVLVFFGWFILSVFMVERRRRLSIPTRRM